MAAFLTMGLLKIWGGIPVGYFLWQVSLNAITLIKNPPRYPPALWKLKNLTCIRSLFKTTECEPNCCRHLFCFLQASSFLPAAYLKERAAVILPARSKERLNSKAFFNNIREIYGRNCQAAPVAIGVAEAWLIQSGFSLWITAPLWHCGSTQ